MGGTAQGLGAEGALSTRGQVIEDLYKREGATVRRLVAGRARVPDALIEDACQTAWERLCSHEDVNLPPVVAVRWLVVTASRVAWRHGRRRETSVRLWAPDAESGHGEPAGGAPDPLDVVIEHERSCKLAGRLGVLTDRERRFLVMRAMGLSYREIGERTGATVRTVERQLVRGRRKLRERSL